MRKKYLLVIFLLSLLFFGCNSGENQLLISIYLEGSKNNQCIEIYNFSDADVDLSKYKIEIYGTGNKVKSSIKLSGNLSSKSCYVVANSLADNELQTKANLKTDKLVFVGHEAVGLTFNGNLVDVIGNPGFRNVLKDKTLIRKIDMVEPKVVYDEYDYIIYGINEYDYLGEFVNSVTPEELLEGPKFVNQYLEEDFILQTQTLSKMGGGGAVEVKLQTNVDGDTAWFVFPDELDITTFVAAENIRYDGGKPSSKVRYQDINTPETYTGNIMEFGWPAKLYTAKVQNEAEKIYIQSVKNNSLLCTYGRIMGYVFATKGNDSVCVNFMIILQGYSTIAVSENYDLFYKDIPYYGYMYNAMLYAKRNQKGLWGEKDPYWDYINDKSIYA